MTSFMVVDAERRLIMSGSEADSPGVSKDAFGAKRKSEKHV